MNGSCRKHAGDRGKLRVCVIGAGVCGLVATKICLENGLDVVCFDKSLTYGGLWQYKPDDEANPDGPFEPSVMRTTILNTPKELSSFSDFPPPAELPNFMSHDQYMGYIDSYVEKFNLRQHIKLGHKVDAVWPEWHSADFYSDKRDHVRWMVNVRHVTSDAMDSRLMDFDCMMIAVGHHNIPYEPYYAGQEKFTGQILHSARLKDILANERMANKRVLVVGLGNSACDAANDISLVANKCYVSCHRGQWFSRRNVMHRGSRWRQYQADWLPTAYNDKRQIEELERHVDHELLGLRPKHMPSELSPAINDVFPIRILAGKILLKGAIEMFTEKGVKFVGDDEEYPIDAAVLATGYEAKIKFMNETELGIRSPENNNEYNLFLNIFAPKIRIADCKRAPETPVDKPGRDPYELIKTLAFIGLVQPNGSMTVISEMQARLACLVFRNQAKLPSMDSMLEHMEKWRLMRSKSVRSHSRDQLIGSYLFYMETMARLAGVMPDLRKLFFTDIKLWRALMFGPTVPYQYRLRGPGRWPEARDTILSTNDRIRAGYNEGKNPVLYKSRGKRLQDASSKSNKQANLDKKRTMVAELTSDGKEPNGLLLH